MIIVGLFDIRMHRFCIVVLFVIGTTTLIYSQDVLDKIAEDGCNCIKEIQVDKKTSDQIEMELGLCIIQAAVPYEQELKEEYKIRLSRVSGKDGEKLGRLVGVRMFTNCPEYLNLFEHEGEIAGSEEVPVPESIKGKLIRIETNQFNVLIIQDDEGKTYKFLWLDYFPNSDELIQNFEKYKNFNITVEYDEKEFYDPRIKEYIIYKIIRKVEL